MRVRSLAGMIAGALVLAACSDTLPTKPASPELSLSRKSSASGPKKYIVVAEAEAIPQTLSSDVALEGCFEAAPVDEV